MLDSFYMIFLVLLPAAFANMAPPFVMKIFPNFNYPMDFNLKLGGKRVFGSHKTMRGLIFGVIAGQLSFMIIRYLVFANHTPQHIVYETYLNLPYFFGAFLGFFALLGDAIKSFFKRRVGVEPGNPWFPFDQIDWVVAGLAYTSLYTSLDFRVIGFALFLGLSGHLISKAVGFVIGLNKDPI